MNTLPQKRKLLWDAQKIAIISELREQRAGAVITRVSASNARLCGARSRGCTVCARPCAGTEERYEYECERKLSVPLSLWKNSRRAVVEDETITIRAYMHNLRHSLIQTIIIKHTNTVQLHYNRQTKLLCFLLITHNGTEKAVISLLFWQVFLIF